MRSTSEILTDFYKACIEKGIQDLVSGLIYKGVNHSGQGEYITIKVLSNQGRRYVQQGFINLNLFIESLPDGRPDLKRFETVTQQIHTLLGSVVTDNKRFQIEQESGVLPDESQDKMFFINFKFNFQTIS